MKRTLLLASTLISIILLGCSNQTSDTNQPFKAFNLDFNWGEGGPNAFAAPGQWADANPAEHIDWYEELGCNTIQTFAVSCNGYAWYKNGVIPEQPGLKYDFLPEMVRLGHEKGMKVFGYFCVGANTKWGLDHPELSYGTPSDPHIPFTTQYLDYLCKSIEEALILSNMDGFMMDWIWNPGSTMEPYPQLKWLDCEKVMYKELIGEEFPGIDNITAEQEQLFRRKAIDRCWKRIRETAKRVKPECQIWLTCCQVTSKDVINSDMFRETDILMNEDGDIESIEAIRAMIGKHTKLVTCLANWNGKDPAKIIPEAIKANIGLYGFAKPDSSSLLSPIDYYMTSALDSLTGDSRNIASFARVYNDLPLSYVK